MADESLVKGQVSWSQISKPCGYQLLMDMEVWDHEKGLHEGAKRRLCRICQGLPEPKRGIGMIFGSAWEASIQFHVSTGADSGAALEHGLRVLHDEIAKAETRSGVRWDDPVRMTNGWWDKRNDCWKEPPRPYKGDEGRMPDQDTAENYLALGTAGWIRAFAGRFQVVGYQEELYIPLEGEFAGWRVKGKLDFRTDEGGIIDTKASASDSWAKEDLDDKIAQLHLYQRGFLLQHGHPPAYSVFHLLHTGSDHVEVIEVPYNEERIETVLVDWVYPKIRAKQSGGLTPQLKGFQHSEKWCDHWAGCPFGASARGGFIRLEAVA